MSNPEAGRMPADGGYAVLGEVEDRVLWLASAMIHHANRVRPNPSGLKVGGHQASSASMVSIMTSLWFGHLRAEDRVSVKPHARAARDQLPARQARCRVPAPAPRVRRSAELSEPDEGSRPGRLLDGVGRHRCHRAGLPSRHRLRNRSSNVSPGGARGGGKRGGVVPPPCGATSTRRTTCWSAARPNSARRWPKRARTGCRIQCWTAL